MPAVKTLAIITALLICFVLLVPHAALAQGLDEATALNQQVIQLYNQGRFSEALPLAQRALGIREKHSVPIIASLNSLAELYRAQGRYADAEPLYKRALAIWEKAHGLDRPNVAIALNNLADLYRTQGRYSDAIPIVRRTISQNSARKTVALAALYGSQSQKLITPNQALEAGYTVLQQSVSSAAGAAVFKLAARFAAGTNELAQLVRKDQDLTAEAERLDKSIVAALSKAPAERNHTTEDPIRKRFEDIKFERDKLQDIFNQRFPDYVALSKPQPLTIEQTQELLANDEALVAVDLDKSSYIWVVTKDRAEWKELSVSAEDVSKEVETLRAGLNPNSPTPLTAISHISSINRCSDACVCHAATGHETRLSRSRP